jgi:hypothetical protein
MISIDPQQNRLFRMKNTVECFLNIDIRKWQRQGLLMSGNFFNVQWSRSSKVVGKMVVLVQRESLILSYRSQGKYVRESVILATTACHFGGYRYWFRCDCGKRVAILYAGESRFACRHCLNLNYQTQHQEPHERLAKKAHRLRDRLEWPRGFRNGSGPKPKGMHWSTFEHLLAEAEAVVEQCNVAARSRFKGYEGFG